MKRLTVLVLAFALMACTDAQMRGMPEMKVQGATVPGVGGVVSGPAYCIFLSALVGTLGGGMIGALLPASQNATGSSTATWGAVGTAVGAGLGGVTGYTMCPMPTAVAGN